MPLEALGRKRKGWREDDTLLADSTALHTVLSPSSQPQINVTYLGGHVVQRVESRVEVRDEQLRWQRREERLSVRSEVRRNLRTLPNANLDA